MATEPANGFSTKEMLVRIDGKLDVALARITAVELHEAVHAAKPFHSLHVAEALENRLTQNSKDIGSIRQNMKYAAGAVGVIVLLAPFVWSIVFK